MLQFLLTLIDIYTWLIIARVLLSWFPIPRNEFVLSIYSLLYQATEPYLGLFRRFIPNFGALDISPIVAIMVLWALQSFLVRAI